MMTLKFWKSYFGDWQRLVVIFMTLALIVIVAALFLPFKNLIPFIIGFTLSDPFSYYFVTYKKHNTQ